MHARSQAHPSPPPPPLPFSHTLTHLARHLNYDALHTLKTNGYLVIDHALPYATTTAIQAEIQKLDSLGELKNNFTAYVGHHLDKEKPHITHLFPKPHIDECELFPHILPLVPTLESVSTALVPHVESIFHRSWPQLGLFPGQTSIKAQINRGFGAFPYHYDSPGGQKDSRRIICLLYLNENYAEKVENALSGEENTDSPSCLGGEIRLQPFLRPCVDIVPCFNRMVLFRSDEMLHRVLTARQQRMCITIWFHGDTGDAADSKEHNATEAETQDFCREGSEAFVSRWLHLLHQVEYQRALSKAVYFDEWMKSFQESHTGSGDTELTNSLRNDVNRLMHTENMAAVVKLLREMHANMKPVRIRGISMQNIQQQRDEYEKLVEMEREKQERLQKELAEQPELELECSAEGEMSFLDFL